ncbi:hypothetical protein BC829DRAFT_86593 [Chytridium lagenaria]|nr:hypothetical protein BC829DRAFT_86593 [Chytridium lagenaria]
MTTAPTTTRSPTWRLLSILSILISITTTIASPSQDDQPHLLNNLLHNLEPIGQSPQPANRTTFLPSCPPPLIRTPSSFTPSTPAFNVTDPLRRYFCASGCCLPCPSLNYVYPPKLVENVWAYHIPICFGIGTLGALGILVTHLVVPTRRSSPSAPSIINVQLGLIIMGGSMALGIPDSKVLLCVNEIERAMGSSNLRCFIQVRNECVIHLNVEWFFLKFREPCSHLAQTWPSFFHPILSLFNISLSSGTETPISPPSVSNVPPPPPPPKNPTPSALSSSNCFSGSSRFS